MPRSNGVMGESALVVVASELDVDPIVLSLIKNDAQMPY
jgi:hypothetical protein